MPTHFFLPSRGVFLPTHVLFTTHLPPAVLITWIQLRALAWEDGKAQSIDTHRLAALTGKSQATLNRHVSILKQRGMLDGHLAGKGTKSIQESHQGDKPAASMTGSCKYPPQPEHSSYFPARILGYISYDDETETP